MQSFLKTKIGIFIDFVNILETEDRQKRRQRNSYKFLFHWNLIYFWEFFTNGTTKYVSWSLSCTLSPLAGACFSTGREYGVGLFSSFRLMTGWFPASFSVTKTKCLKIIPLISLSKKSPPSSKFPDFPNTLTLFHPFDIVVTFGGFDCFG